MVAKALVRGVVYLLLWFGFVVGVLMIVKIIDDQKTRNFEKENELNLKAAAFLREQNHELALGTLFDVYKLGGCNNTCLSTIGALQVLKGDYQEATFHCKESLLRTYVSPWPCSNADALRCIVASSVGCRDWAEAFAHAEKLRVCGTAAPLSLSPPHLSTTALRTTLALAAQALATQHGPSHPDASFVVREIAHLVGMQEAVPSNETGRCVDGAVDGTCASAE